MTRWCTTRPQIAAMSGGRGSGIQVTHSLTLTVFCHWISLLIMTGVLLIQPWNGKQDLSNPSPSLSPIVYVRTLSNARCSVIIYFRACPFYVIRLQWNPSGSRFCICGDKLNNAHTDDFDTKYQRLSVVQVIGPWKTIFLHKRLCFYKFLSCNVLSCSIIRCTDIHNYG